MKPSRLLLILGVLVRFPGTGASQIPHLAGVLELDPPGGLLDGRLCLTRFAPRRAVRFLLASPLNIRVVTDTLGRAIRYRGEEDQTRIRSEAREYTVEAADSLTRLTGFCVQYRGAVPPFDSVTAFATDWKGRITSIHGNLRAAEQTRWYPTLYDSTSGAMEERVTYQLRVRCASCGSIYVNGSDPVADTVGAFRSASPRTLLLFAGRFGIATTPAVTFLNGRADSATARIFSEAISRIGGYYQTVLGVPYQERPVLLSFESIWNAYPNGVNRWAFVTWPTIAFSGGMDFDQLLDRTGGAPRVPEQLWTTLSHEMGHYYFGTLARPHGPLYWFVLESTAEYLAAKAIGALRGEVVQASRYLDYVSAIGTGPHPALSAIVKQDDISGTYRYQVAPLRLLLLDWEVGESKVAHLLRGLLDQAADQPATYEAVQQAAEQAGILSSQLDGAMSAQPGAMRARVMQRAGAILQSHRADRETAPVVALAASMINADTTTSGRQRVLAVLQAVVAREPGNLRAHYQVGKIGAVAGIGLEPARRSLEKYLRVPVEPGAPAHADASWRLGMVLERLGNTAGAMAAYRRALDLNPEHTAARAALTRLERPEDGFTGSAARAAYFAGASRRINSAR